MERKIATKYFHVRVDMDTNAFILENNLILCGQIISKKHAGRRQILGEENNINGLHAKCSSKGCICKI